MRQFVQSGIAIAYFAPTAPADDTRAETLTRLPAAHGRGQGVVVWVVQGVPAALHTVVHVEPLSFEYSMSTVTSFDWNRL